MGRLPHPTRAVSGRASSRVWTCPRMPRGSCAASTTSRWMRRGWRTRLARPMSGSAPSASNRWPSVSGCSATSRPRRDRADVFVALRGISRYRLADPDARSHRHPSPVGFRGGRQTRDAPVTGRRPARLRGPGAVSGRARHPVAHGEGPYVQRSASPGTDREAGRLPFGDDGRYAGAVAGWLRNSVAAALPPATPSSRRSCSACRGRPPRSACRGWTWEGQPYRLDLGAAERRRLQQVRDSQEGLPLDLALDIAAIGHTLAGEALSLDELPRVVTRLSRMLDETPPRPNRAETENVPPGVSQPSNVHETLQKAVEELSKAIRNKDAKRAARESEPLGDLADQLLAEVLLSISYAADVGDPEGTVLLAGDVSHRHDFGFGAKDSELRQRQAWTMPRQDVSPGVPWRVERIAARPRHRAGAADPAAAEPSASSRRRSSRRTSARRSRSASRCSTLRPARRRPRSRSPKRSSAARAASRSCPERRPLDALADEIAWSLAAPRDRAGPSRTSAIAWSRCFR